jgi:hypothetical protein
MQKCRQHSRPHPRSVGLHSHVEACSSASVRGVCSLESLHRNKTNESDAMKRLLMWAVGVPVLVLGMVMISFNGTVQATDPAHEITARH